MILGLRTLPYFRPFYRPFLSAGSPLFNFSDFFDKQDQKQLFDHKVSRIRKDLLYYKLVKQWKAPLQRKQRRRQRIIQIAAQKAKKVVEPQSAKLVIHNPAVGIQYPPKKYQEYAVIQVDGFQYKVLEDSTLMLDTKQAHAINEPIVFEKVPLIGTKTFTMIGRPYVEGARVQGVIESITDSSKILVFKKKRRKGYKRSFGSRTSLTQCRITNIVYQLSEDILNRAVALM